MREIRGAIRHRPETEAHFQERVQDLAEDHGWAWMHVPRSRVGRGARAGWRTNITGPLGSGWPDLFLARAGRCLWLELKTDAGYPDANQRRVHGILGQCGEVRVVRPRDWAELVSLLA